MKRDLETMEKLFVKYLNKWLDGDLRLLNERKIMPDEAILSSEGSFTSFTYNGQKIRFRTSPKLERYTKIKEWDHGYIVVMAKYRGAEEEEEYIDLIPILQNLYFDADEFLDPIQKVRIKYA